MSTRIGSAQASARRRWWWSLVAVWALAQAVAPVYADDVSVTAAVDQQQVPLNQRLTLTVTVNGTSRAGDPQLPDLPDFSVFSAGSQRLMQSVNFKTTTSTVFTYILVPKSKGSFTIPPVEVLVEQQKLRTDPIAIQVVDAQAEQPARPTRPGQRSGQSDTVDEDAVRLEAGVSDQSVYVGEQLTLTVRFYQDGRFADRPQYQKPETTGFWVEDFPEPRTLYEHIDGRRYHVTELRTALFPTESGEQTIGSARVDCRLRTSSDPFLTDPFSLFGRRRSVPKTIVSEPIVIDVREVPHAGRPPEWDGAVGRYQLTAAADKQTAEVGEAVTLSVTVQGTGNVRLLGDPQLPEVEGMRSYQGEGELSDAIRNDRVGGVKIVRRVFIADEPGDYEIPAIAYAYFDPTKETFVSLTSKPIVLSIQPASGALAAPTSPVAGRQTIDGVAPDLRFIRLEEPNLRPRRGPLLRSAWFWAVQLIPLAFLAGGWLFSRHAERLRVDAAYARQRRSGSVARRRLKEAQSCLGDDPDAFLGALSAALRGFVADRVNSSAAGLTLDEIDRLLAVRGVAPDLVQRYRHVLEQCDLGRFAPGTRDTAGRQQLLDEAAGVLGDLASAEL